MALNVLFARELVAIILDFAKSTDTEKLAFLLNRRDPFVLDMVYNECWPVRLLICREKMEVVIVASNGESLGECKVTLEELTPDGCHSMFGSHFHAQYKRQMRNILNCIVIPPCCGPETPFRRSSEV